MSTFLALEYSSDIVEYLGILMDQEFDTFIEDGSLEEASWNYPWKWAVTFTVYLCCVCFFL